MNTKRRALCAHALGATLVLGLIALPHTAAAAKKSAPKPAKAVVAAETSDPAYEQWLKKYGAYDRMAQPADNGTDDGGQALLKRAEGLLMQGNPQQALSLLEGQTPYTESAEEIRRLWLGGQAHRSLGDPYKAVIWYSHAAKLMDAKDIKARLAGESGLDALWIDVWRRQFWALSGTPAGARDPLELTLRTLLTQAEAAWPQESFWAKAKEALDQPGAAPAPAEQKADKSPQKPAKDAPLLIGPEDRQRIAQALAAAGLEDSGRAREFLSGLSDPALRVFWTAFLDFLATGKAGDVKALSAANYAKAAGFWNASVLAPYAASREEWLLGGGSPAWARFKSSLSQLSRAEAGELVDKELQSLLISEEMSRLLHAAKFVLRLEDGDLEAAKALWEGLDKRKLPVCLRISGGILFQEDLKVLLPQEAAPAAKLSPALSALLAAGGAGAPLPGEAPFWSKVEIGKSSAVNKLWPLDRVLVLADWQARWTAGPGPELARRSAFLFPDTAYGYDCLVYLTQKAVENRSFQLASAYLARMAPLSVDKQRQSVRLGLKAKMERDSGKDEEALATYREILALGVDIDPRTRLDMATFLQLRNDFEGGRKQLLLLWEQRDKFPSAVQAEILFWLGEGEHSLRNYDAALDYYLRLAYQYPKEPMWPTAAMYRSAMIYEIKGSYETAKKLLHSVIATADTKEAKEAARNRLNALEAKSGKPAAKESGEPVYPF